MRVDIVMDDSDTIPARLWGDSGEQVSEIDLAAIPVAVYMVNGASTDFLKVNVPIITTQSRQGDSSESRCCACFFVCLLFVVHPVVLPSCQCTVKRGSGVPRECRIPNGCFLVCLRSQESESQVFVGSQDGDIFALEDIFVVKNNLGTRISEDDVSSGGVNR